MTGSMRVLRNKASGSEWLSYKCVRFVSLFLFFAFITLVFQNYTGGFVADRGNHSDEAAHFVSSLVIADYISSGAPSSPLVFAKDYYAHFPKVAIGHWPPFFEFLLALAFLVFGGTGTVAIVLQAVIAGLCAAIPATIIGKSVGMAEGIVA